jgi:N-succinyldiaminopimelate aminotransferase
MNPHLQNLHPYPFEKLNQLKAGIKPPSSLEPIMLSVGEPKHPAPDFVKAALCGSIDSLAQYPSTRGCIELREAIAQWIGQRFNIRSTALDPELHVLPVAGTREALFAFTQTVVDHSTASKPLVVCPNPFYQIYEGAAILAGADIYYLNCTAEEGFIPDLDSVSVETWKRCQLLQLCSPGNPTGATLSLQYYKQALELAEQYDFIVSSDECYSEIYLDEQQPPLGLLDACRQLGRDNFQRCLVFHSLSKRSNLPGLRSGFVAGDPKLLKSFLNYRTYHGCALSLPVQNASIAAWGDESHVITNRQLYREKFAAVAAILEGTLPFSLPPAGFYLWPQTPIDDIQFTRDLYANENITLLPGQFLSRETDRGNPGRNRVRLALVANIDQCVEAAQRIKRFTLNL